MIFLYIDPGTGSMLISALIALISVGFFMLRGFIYRKLNIGGDKGAILDPDTEYGLVFYSEGSQYYNVFNPLLLECEERKLFATYFTSDKNDPILKSDFDYIEPIYIGSGREAYFILNRLIADMVVMTTPGLDVLEIKRSKNVKHYSHITHATGSVADYNAYGTDYFDSVLLGGSADIEVIRELEKKRNLPAKELKVIGHTYLDVYRNKLETQNYEYSLFKKKRVTILVSPTWGYDGLLTKHGDTLLKALKAANKFNIIVRPHPQSFVSDADVMTKLMSDFPDSDHLVWDRQTNGLIAMSHADIMISDYSGIIFDFLTLFKKPILTMHGGFDKRGRDAKDLDGEPWNLRFFEKIGKTLRDEDIKNLPEIISNIISDDKLMSEEIVHLSQAMDTYPNKARVKGVNYIEAILAKVKSVEKVKDIADKTSMDIESTVIMPNTREMKLLAKVKVGVKVIFNPNTILQVIIALLLFNFYIFLGYKYLLKDGLNQLFLKAILPYFVILLFTVGLVFLALVWIKSKGNILFNKKAEPVKISDLLILGLPMTPIVQYILSNQDILALDNSIMVFGFFFIISFVCIIFIPWLLSPIVSKSLTVSSTTGFLFIMFNMAKFGKTTRHLYIILTLALIALFIFSLMFSRRKKLLVLLTTVFFVSGVGSSIYGLMFDGKYSVVDKVIVESNMLQETESLPVAFKPDVYLLTYESYSNQETMESYGFDNSDHVDYLINEGFAIYDGTYSLGSPSLISMAHVLHLEPVAQSLEDYRKIVASESSVLALYDNLGYKTSISLAYDYMIRGFESKYDHTFPKYEDSIASHKIIISAVLEGEFRFDAEFSTAPYEEYLEDKWELFSEDISKPKLIYTHNLFPGHSQNSGVLLPDETDIHIGRIKVANQEMRSDIEAIRVNDKDAIIIILGDHGPHLTKNGIDLESYDIEDVDRLDVQDRLGAFLAISWPDKQYNTKYDIEILQDIFPSVLSYMYNDDSLFDKLRMERISLEPKYLGGVKVVDGIIVGGIDDGKPLFINTDIRD